MASSASSVFIDNIPLHVTEEQIRAICELAGPIASFRLAIGRETGEHNGYGFCEYKDEETALSARRNLQGYEINGSKLSFAENLKGTDKNKHCSPLKWWIMHLFGSDTDLNRNFVLQIYGGPGLLPSSFEDQRPPIFGDPSLHQPMGHPLASAAADVMAKALSGPQLPSLQSSSGVGNDPLTHYLANMSTQQMNDIMSEMKGLATQNYPLVRQLLQDNPQLSKALFQAQIMLGHVTPEHMQMQMAINRQSSRSIPETLQQCASQPQHVPVLPQSQHPSPLGHQLHPQGLMPGISGVPPLLSLQHGSLGNLSIQPQNPPLHTPTGSISQIYPPFQYPGPIGGANTADHSHMPFPNPNVKQPLLPHQDLAGPSRLSTDPSRVVRPRFEEGSNVPQMVRSNGVSGLPVATGSLSGSQTATVNLIQQSENQIPQFSPEEQLDLLQQMMSLTPDQLSSLSPDQQQQVLQLQVLFSSEEKFALLRQMMSLTPDQLSSLPPEQREQVLQLQRMLR